LKQKTMLTNAIRERTPSKTPTVLQKHVEFFDWDEDGVISCWDTYNAMRALGWSKIISFLAIFIINGTMGWPSNPRRLPTFNIHISNINWCTHGSDASVYDTLGGVVKYNFEDIWKRFDRDGDGKMTFWELMDMTESKRDIWDFYGWITSKIEWSFFFFQVADDGGKVSKEDMWAIYDGSLFQRIAQNPKKER